jgi:hypothetical protein
MVYQKQNQVNKFLIQIYLYLSLCLGDKSKDQESVFQKIKRAIFDLKQQIK